MSAEDLQEQLDEQTELLEEAQMQLQAEEERTTSLQKQLDTANAKLLTQPAGGAAGGSAESEKQIKDLTARCKVAEVESAQMADQMREQGELMEEVNIQLQSEEDRADKAVADLTQAKAAAVGGAAAPSASTSALQVSAAGCCMVHSFWLTLATLAEPARRCPRAIGGNAGAAGREQDPAECRAG
jgi:hypothetical protein